MAATWAPGRVMNGTFGKAWLNGEYVFEAKALEASLEMQMEDVTQSGEMGKAQKFMGYSGSGTLRTHKVNSRAVKLIGEKVRAGENPEFVLNSELNDPAAFGAERIVLTGVQFTTLPLINWEHGTLGEVELPFTFTGYRVLDAVNT